MPDLEFLEKYVPKAELESLIEGTKGEEKEHFDRLIQETIERIKSVPPLYGESEKLGMMAPVKLHYFGGGSDWWITSLDKENDVAFGFVCLNGMTEFAELGFIRISELLSATFPIKIKLLGGKDSFEMRVGIELDLYWKERPLGEIIKEVRERC